MIQVWEETAPRKIYSKKIALGTMSLELFLKTGTEALRLLTHRIAGKWNGICHRSYFSRSSEDNYWRREMIDWGKGEAEASFNEFYESSACQAACSAGLIPTADWAGPMPNIDLHLHGPRRNKLIVKSKRTSSHAS